MSGLSPDRQRAAPGTCRQFAARPFEPAGKPVAAPAGVSEPSRAIAKDVMLWLPAFNTNKPRPSAEIAASIGPAPAVAAIRSAS